MKILISFFFLASCTACLAQPPKSDSAKVDTSSQWKVIPVPDTLSVQPKLTIAEIEFLIAAIDDADLPKKTAAALRNKIVLCANEEMEKYQRKKAAEAHGRKKN